MRLSLLLPILAACTTGSSKSADTATADLPPDIVVSTASLRFGLLAPGTEEVKRFTVRRAALWFKGWED